MCRGDNVVAIDLITEHIRLKLQQHDLRRIYPNLEVGAVGGAASIGAGHASRCGPSWHGANQRLTPRTPPH